MKQNLSPEATAQLVRINAELLDIRNGSAHGPVPKAWLVAIWEADWEAEKHLVLASGEALEGYAESFVGTGQ